MNEKLTDENFMLFCAKHYDNSKYASTEEFYEDISRLKYIKKLITRYTQDGDLKERLILNHIIILNNCFGPEALNKILFLKMRKQMSYLKPFLVILNILPEKVYNVNEEFVIDTNLIEMDPIIIKKLRGL